MYAELLYMYLHVHVHCMYFRNTHVVYEYTYVIVCTCSLVTSLQAADQKKQRLEKKLEEILKEKNSKIHELELRIAELQEHQVRDKFIL